MRIEPVRRLAGKVALPGDKSISHRYAILAAMARGVSSIANYSASRDCQSTLQCLAELGVRHLRERDCVTVEGTGGEFQAPQRALDAGNSGTTLRLLSGLLASQPFAATIAGDDSLNRRPMKRIIEPLTLMGARIESSPGDFPPLTIQGGPLRGVRYQPPVASAQVKSCVLLAGLRAQGETTVCEPASTRDHTERALPVFGVEVRRRGDEISVSGGSPLRAAALSAPGDFSSAAFFLLAAVLCPGSDLLLENLGENPTRTGLLRLLLESGANLRCFNRREVCGEPVCDVRAGFTAEVFSRFPQRIGGAWIPNLIDEIPALAVLGVGLAQGLEIVDAGELRKKESDRISAVALNLRSLGVAVDESPDGFRIPPGQTLRGGKVRTFGDHRIAMAFTIASALAEGPVELDDPDCAAVSFPAFFEEFRSVTSA